MNTKGLFDVLIIGAGPIGLACGIEAGRNKLKYIIIEKGSIVNSIFNYPANMTFFSTSERIEIGDVPFVSHGVKPTRKEALEYYRRVKGAYDLNVITYERVLEIEKKNDIFKILTNKNKYTARNVIIATGYYDNPNFLEVKGESMRKVKHYFDEPHPYAYHKTIVAGAGNSAVDVALELFRVGAEVTMVIREDRIKPSIKYWVKPDIENRIKENSIKAFFESEIEEVKEKSVVIKTPGGLIEIENDFVFAMTGYHSDIEFLIKTGIDLDDNKNAVFNTKTFETNIKGIYLAGVVCGGKNTDIYFIENSIVHSKIIIDHIVKHLHK